MSDQDVKMNGAEGELIAPKKTRKRKAKTVKDAAKTVKERKPRGPRGPRNPAALDEFGLLRGSFKSKAAALYAREGGATLAEIEQEIDRVQFNVLTQLASKGYEVKRVKEGQVTRYFLTR